VSWEKLLVSYHITGFLNWLGVEMVPQLIKEYRQRHPKVQFTLVQSSGKMLMEGLIEGGIDLCLSIYRVFEQSVFAGAIFWTKNLVIAWRGQFG